MNSKWSGDVRWIDKVNQQGRINYKKQPPGVQKASDSTMEDFGRQEQFKHYLLQRCGWILEMNRNVILSMYTYASSLRICH